MAAAYGGVVERSSKGLALGLHEYQLVSHERWMDSVGHIVLPVDHYDQIVVAPESARVLASSTFCTYAALSHRERRAVSFQGHPELSERYKAWLTDKSREAGVPGMLADQNDDSARVMSWIRHFFERDQLAPITTIPID